MQEPWLEGNHEPIGGGLAGQRGGKGPRVLGHRERGQQTAKEPGRFTGSGDGGDVVDVAVAIECAPAHGRGDIARAVAVGVAAVVAARGTQGGMVAFHADAPIDVDAHAVVSCRVRPAGSARNSKCSLARCTSSMFGCPDNTMLSKPAAS